LRRGEAELQRPRAGVWLLPRFTWGSDLNEILRRRASVRASRRPPPQATEPLRSAVRVAARPGISGSEGPPDAGGVARWIDRLRTALYFIEITGSFMTSFHLA